MTDHNYPIALADAPARFDFGTYAAIWLEELGFPPVVGEDKERLSAALNGFLYERPAEAMPR